MPPGSQGETMGLSYFKWLFQLRVTALPIFVAYVWDGFQKLRATFKVLNPEIGGDSATSLITQFILFIFIIFNSYLPNVIFFPTVVHFKLLIKHDLTSFLKGLFHHMTLWKESQKFMLGTKYRNTVSVENPEGFPVITSPAIHSLIPTMDNVL